MSKKNTDTFADTPDEADVFEDKPTERNTSEDKSVEEDVLKLNKEEMFKIVENPYFQYLVEKKSRAQTRSYLILVGSAILVILAYAGWEFKSVKELINNEKAAIEKDKAAIQSSRTEIEKTSADAKKQQEQMLMTADSVRDKVTNSEKLFEDSRQFAERSSNMTNGMLTAAQGNIENSQNAQKELFQQQSKLLSSTFTAINREAEKQLGEVNNRIKGVNDLMEGANKRIEISSDKVDKVIEKADKVNKADETLKDLTGKAEKLGTTQQELLKIQQRLLEGGLINGTVFLRSKKESTIKMLDPDDPKNKAKDWLITFTRFKLSDKEMSIWGVAQKGKDKEILFEVNKLDARFLPIEKKFKPLPNGIPFQIQLNFAYHTVFSVDFASLNIAGIPSAESILNNISSEK